MRLIDADALAMHLADWQLSACSDQYDTIEEAIDAVAGAPTIDAVPVETVCEMFGNEAPCNYGLFGVSVGDFMYSMCGDWCESNCDKVPYTECWQKLFEAIEKWRKDDE